MVKHIRNARTGNTTTPLQLTTIQQTHKYQTSESTKGWKMGGPTQTRSRMLTHRGSTTQTKNDTRNTTNPTVIDTNNRKIN